jgi:hypothetical protein
MKTLSQLVSEAHGTEQPEYLKHALIGREEIGRFAAALREQTIEEAVAAATGCGSIEHVIANLKALKGPKA